METETQPTPAQAVPVQRAEVVVVDGVMAPRNIDEAFRVAKSLVVSGMLPERYKTAETVFAAMQYASELGLKPMTALRQIAVVKGTPCIFGDLPLALCQSKGLVEWIKESIYDKDGKEICRANNNLTAEVFGSVTTVKRKGDAEPLERFFTMDDAKTAGLLNSPTWKSYPKLMLKYRARSQALKDKFADCLNGIAIAEYDFHVTPIEGDIEAAVIANDPAAELQSRFADSETQ